MQGEAMQEFKGSVNVCAQQVAFRYEDIKTVLTSDLKKRLTITAEEEAEAMITLGGFRGELRLDYTDADAGIEEDIYGWWGIVS